MKTLTPNKWIVTHYPPENAPGGATPVSIQVYAVNRRFALWNARDYIGFPAPGSKVTASIVKK
jgi:hypothetical protein